jgi:hypothetical protein
MLTTIQDAVKQYLPAKKKTSTSGWISFNAVCCEHNGENRDNRGRGGLIANSNGSVSYSCFNCGFKANYTPGRHLNYKFRKLLSWLGADENSIKRLVIDAIRVKELVGPDDQGPKPEEEVSFTPRPLPTGAKSFQQWQSFLLLQNVTGDEPVPEHVYKTVEYIASRGGHLLERYEFYTTDDDEHNMHKRVIVPCYWQGQLIGSTSRAYEDGIKPKYYADYEPNFVFNMDRQTPDKKFVIVSEGPFDAMAIDGVAVLSNECSEIQADIIDSLGREVIVVPDFDSKLVKGKNVWAGSKLVEQAIEYGWSVSFPIWNENVKDISEAVKQYGKLFTLKAILAGKQSSRLKIELHKKRIHS